MINRQVALIIFGRLFTSYGYYLVIPFLMIYMTQHLSMSVIESGILIAILNLGRRGLGILAGYWSDKFGARNMILLGLALEVLAYSTMGWVKNFWLLVGIIFLSGAGGCLYNISSRSILAEAQEAQNTAIGFGLFYITMHIGALLGPLTYVYFTQQGIISLSFLFSAILYGIFLLLTAMCLKISTQTKSVSNITLKDMISIFSSRSFMFYCGLLTGGWFILNQLYVSLPLYVLSIHESEQSIAHLNAWNAVLIITIQYWCSRMVGRLNISAKFTLFGLGILLMGTGWALCIMPSKSMLYLAIAVFTIGEILFIAVVDLLALTFAPPGQSGLYLGFSTFTWAIGGALASIIGSTFYTWVVAIHHLEWLWLGLLIVSFILSMCILSFKERLADGVNKLQLIQAS